MHKPPPQGVKIKNDMGKKKKIQPTCKEILDSIESYRKQLYESSTVSSTKFAHMQNALHWAKNIVRDHFGEERKGDIGWVK